MTSPDATLDPRFDVPLRGVAVDGATRCTHYRSDRDVVALRHACCDTYYPCHACHEELADHETTPWPRERFDDPAVLCGVCRTTLSAETYLACDHACPACGAAFNPGCARHADRYFAVE
ncbi:CHY zinc finger protein [Halomarina ordinaria]|uniref:CHY zinc finger protein n=1 Tax=Halomarina ordinaria TaxID=3033939 RepID=A0ABD5UB79_9EURY|nr:CHY zinc finger protein [Halomarina sp. PSRA2]